MLRLVPHLLKAVTIDPAMLQWLNGIETQTSTPNEQRTGADDGAVTLGADRDAYTEDDVREQAPALTG